MESSKTFNKRMLVLAIVALLLAIATVVGVSFARYITTGDSVSDSATVATWGVEVTGTSDGIFSSSYKYNDTTVVQSVSESQDVVAPGTSGNLIAYTLTGSPEVLTKVSCNLNFEFTNWNIENGDEMQFYCPLIFTIFNGTSSTEIYGSGYKTSSQLAAALNNAISNYGYAYYVPNTELESANTSLPSITWRWDFQGSDTAYNGANAGQTNELDTVLGNYAAGTISGGVPTITVTGTVTAEQVQSTSSASASTTTTTTTTDGSDANE
jgi:hypothetical protein